MPQPTKGPRLGAGPAHQRLMLAGLATNLFESGALRTTEAKARRLRPLAERLITKAKRGDLHARRQVLRVVRDDGVVHTLFTEIGPRYANRPGGYTRITKVGPRKGDNAPMAVIELVEPLTAAEEATRATTASAASGQGAALAGSPAPAAPAAPPAAEVDQPVATGAPDAPAGEQDAVEVVDEVVLVEEQEPAAPDVVVATAETDVAVVTDGEAVAVVVGDGGADVVVETPDETVEVVSDQDAVAVVVDEPAADVVVETPDETVEVVDEIAGDDETTTGR